MANAQPYKFDWTQPQGSQLRQQGMEFAGIDAGALNQQAAVAGQQQREQNIGAYNAAVASQRGGNPALAQFGMGQNLASTNAQTGANVQNIQAQNTFGAATSNQGALLDYYKTLTGANAQKYTTDTEAKTAKRGQNIGFFSDVAKSLVPGFASAGATALFSDENMKEPVSDSDDHMHHYMMGRHEQKEQMAQDGKASTEQFMSSLKPQEFQYRPETAGADGGQAHTGVMAQDLEKTPQGAQAVMDTPEGKMVDTKQLSMMLAAAMGDLHMRLSRLEGGQHGKA